MNDITTSDYWIAIVPEQNSLSFPRILLKLNNSSEDEAEDEAGLFLIHMAGTINTMHSLRAPQLIPASERDIPSSPSIRYNGNGGTVWILD